MGEVVIPLAGKSYEDDPDLTNGPVATRSVKEGSQRNSTTDEGEKEKTRKD